MVNSFRFLCLIGMALAELGFCSDSPRLKTVAPPPVAPPVAKDWPAASPADVWIVLLHLDSVQGELALSDHQKERLQEIGQRITKRAREDIEQLNRLGVLPTAKHAALVNLAEQVRQEMVQEILQPRQLLRLKQLVIQLYGIGALHERHVQSSLGLSLEQKERIEEICRETIRQLHEIADAPTGSGEMRWAKAQAIKGEWEKGLLAVLTADQREQFKQLAGREFPPDFQSCSSSK